MNLIGLESGGWNFDLNSVSHPDCYYYSPLASYISPERAIRRAREHARRLALSAGARIGKFRITEGGGEGADFDGQVGPVGRVGQNGLERTGGSDGKS